MTIVRLVVLIVVLKVIVMEMKNRGRRLQIKYTEQLLFRYILANVTRTHKPVVRPDIRLVKQKNVVS